MNWEVDVYKVSARCRVCVHGVETKEAAEKAAMKSVQKQEAKLVETGQGWIAVAASWPYDQFIKISNTPRAMPPKGWSPSVPQWMTRKAVAIGGKR